jgi:Rod binding domain-containing protein
MTIPPLETRKIAVDRLPSLGMQQASRLASAESALGPSGSISPSDAKLEMAARQLVGATFFGTLLKQMHNSPFKSEIFSGGRGEEAFSPIMDQHLIERMSRGTGEKLVKAIVKRFHRNAAEAEADRNDGNDPLKAYRKPQEAGRERTDRRA